MLVTCFRNPFIVTYFLTRFLKLKRGFRSRTSYGIFWTKERYDVGVLERGLHLSFRFVLSYKLASIILMRPAPVLMGCHYFCFYGLYRPNCFWIGMNLWAVPTYSRKATYDESLHKHSYIKLTCGEKKLEIEGRMGKTSPATKHTPNHILSGASWSELSYWMTNSMKSSSHGQHSHGRRETKISLLCLCSFPQETQKLFLVRLK